MATEVSEDLVAFLRDRANEYLRSVVHYDEDSYELLYLRPDVEEKYGPEDIEQVIQELRFESMETEWQETLYPHGELGCTLRCFENAVELHFPYRGFEGVAVAFDPEAATELHSFVGECLEQIPDELTRL